MVVVDVDGLASHPKPRCRFRANYISQRELYTTETSVLQLITFQNSSKWHFILKDTQDMNIYLIPMTTEQSDNNSQKSEHETLQLRYSREKSFNLRVQAREDWRKRHRMVATNQTWMDIDRKKTTLLNWPEAAQKYSAYKVEKMSVLSRNVLFMSIVIDIEWWS